MIRSKDFDRRIFLGSHWDFINTTLANVLQMLDLSRMLRAKANWLAVFVLIRLTTAIADDRLLLRLNYYGPLGPV